MLIQCITLVKIHCITCITLNYLLTETLPLGYRLYSRELDPQQLSCMKICILHSQFPVVQFACTSAVKLKLSDLYWVSQ